MAAVDNKVRKSSGGNAAPLHRRDSRKIAEQYAGAGKTFKVKCIGSEEVSDSKGDTVAADCLKRLRSVCEEVSPQKLAKATISLQFKGVTVFDEKSRTITLQVPVEKVTYVCHDPEESCVFAVIVRSEEGKLKLHGFKADLKTAISFVHSARELFQLMFKLMKAKKKISVQQEEGIQLSPLSEGSSKSVIPQVTGTGSSIQADLDTAPREPQKASREHDNSAVIEEWKVLEKELNQIAKELGMEDDTKPGPQENISMQLNSSTSSDPFSDDFFQKSFESPSKFNSAGGGQTSSPRSQHHAPKDEISLILNPFDSNNAPFGHSSPKTGLNLSSGTDTSFELTNPLFRSPGSSGMFSNSQQPLQQQMPFYSPPQQPLGFSPNTGVHHSQSASSNPFATDFESPPFGVSPHAPVPFQNAGSFLQPSINNQSAVSVTSDLSDPFADLIPFATRPDKSPLAKRQPAPQQEQHALKTKLSWDTFEEPKEEPKLITQELQRPMSREKVTPRTDSFHAQFEDSFQDMPEQQKKTSFGGFEDNFENSFQEFSSGRPPSGFEDNFQSQHTGHEAQKAVLPFPGLSTSENRESPKVKTANVPLESGFADHFVSFSEGPSPSTNGSKEKFTDDKAVSSKPSWIAFTS